MFITKQQFMQVFTTKLGCPQSAADRLDAFTMGGGAAFDLMDALEKQAAGAVQAAATTAEQPKANIVNLLDEKGHAPEQKTE